MMSDVPTVGELFPAQVVPTVSELFPVNEPTPLPRTIAGAIETSASLDGEHLDNLFAPPTTAGKVLEAFGVGLKQGWGHRPLGEFEATEGRDPFAKQLRDLGLVKDYDDFAGNWVKQFNESLLRGTAAGVDLLMRGPIALYYGVGNVAVEAGLPRDIVGLPEAFPAGRYTGYPARPQPRVSLEALEDARRLEIIGDGTAAEARQASAPEGVERPTERVVASARAAEEAAVVPENVPEASPGQPTDIHTTARMVAPDTFKVYDALAEQKEVFRQWIDELQASKAETPRARELQRTIDETLGKVRGVEDRLTKRAAARVEAARAELDLIMRTD
jgi:hypothetical protein